MPTVLAIQHIACEGLGSIGPALQAAGLTVQTVRPYMGDAVPPSPEGLAGLVIMGGPMGVYEADQHPNLTAEMTLARSAVNAGVPTLGVCLGSQLLAAALGAEVRPSGGKEIGWRPLELLPEAADDPLLHDLPQPFTAFHWHGDVFTLPPGAVPLARSAQTRLQAFRAGLNAYGLLFHLEVDASAIRGMVAEFPDELQAAQVDVDQIHTQAQVHLPALSQAASVVFGRFALSCRGG